MDLYKVDFPIEDYCHAVGYDGPLANNVNVITALQRCQLMNIPFENFDVLKSNAVSMEPGDIIDKLLYQPRGGYCYELNGLFAMLLYKLQIPHSLILARPMFYPEKRPKTHMVIVAQIQGQLYLLDTGFGSYGPREPIRLFDLDITQQQDAEKFRVNKNKNEEFVLHAKVDDEWKAQYAFSLVPQEWIDFVPVNYFNSTHENSIFTQKPVVLLHTPEGRNILFGNQFKSIKNGIAEVKDVPDEEQKELLEMEFGIELD